jgi:hypothetical protein
MKNVSIIIFSKRISIIILNSFDLSFLAIVAINLLLVVLGHSGSHILLLKYAEIC